jgi:hypothetical protein
VELSRGAANKGLPKHETIDAPLKTALEEEGDRSLEKALQYARNDLSGEEFETNKDAFDTNVEQVQEEVQQVEQEQEQE